MIANPAISVGWFPGSGTGNQGRSGLFRMDYIDRPCATPHARTGNSVAACRRTVLLSVTRTVPFSVACPFLFPEQPTSRACRTSTHAFPRWPRTRALTGPMPPCRAHWPVRCAPAGWRQPAVSPAVSGAQSLLIPCGSDGSYPGRTPGRGCFWPLSSARQVRVVMSVSSCPCRHFRAGFPGRPPVRSLLPAPLSPSRSPSCCKRSRKLPCRSARSSSASRCRFV